MILHVLKGDERERVVKALLMKGKALPVGSIREHGGRMMIKTPQGWKTHYEAPNPAGRFGDTPAAKMPEGFYSAKKGRHSKTLLAAAYKKRPAGQGGAAAITSKEDMAYLLSNTTLAYISADPSPAEFNRIPGAAGMSDDEKKAAMEDLSTKRRHELERDLVKLGYVFTPSMGMYKGMGEPSYLVMTHDADKDEVLALGTKYNQESIIYANGEDAEMIKTDSPDNPEDERGKTDMAGSGYTVLKGSKKKHEMYTEVRIKGQPYRIIYNLSEVSKSLKTRLLMPYRRW